MYGMQKGQDIKNTK